MTSTSNAYFFLGAAVVGIMSAAGMYLVEHFRSERRRHTMSQNLARIDQQVMGLQKELDQLRKLQKDKSAVKVRKRKSINTASIASDDPKLVSEIDSSDLEFYDLSDEEESVKPTELNLALLDEKLDDDSLDVVNEVLEKLRDLCLESPEDPELLWRIGKAHYKIASDCKDVKIKREHIENGILACESALNLNPRAGDAHKWIANLIGIRTALQPIKLKVRDGFMFKEHLDQAVVLLPNDSAIRHMVGRFAFEAASLKWYERKACSAFFAVPPTGTFDEALNYFLESDRLSTVVWKENTLYIAKCQIALGRYKDAAKTLKDASTITTSSRSEVDAEVNVLLQKYNSYS